MMLSFGGGHRGNGGHGFGFDDDELHRGDWSEKSDAASARENSARAAFEQLVLNNKTKTNAETVELLKPSTHLTQPCWRDFKKFVSNHAGWSAKRREATAAEKQQHGEKRKGAVYFVDVTFKPPKSSGTAAAGKKTVKKTPVDPAAEAAATASMASGMSAWMAGAKRPAEEKEAAPSSVAPAGSKKQCVEPGANGFELRWSRTSKVVEWDEDTFVDCRPSEAQDNMEDHIKAAKKYDFVNVTTDEVDGGNCAMLHHLRAAKGVFDSVAEANDAAKKCMAKMLELEAQGDRGTLTAVCDGTDAEWSFGFKPPPSSTEPAEAMSTDNRGTYTGKLTLFCDVHGCDVHNVVTSELKVEVVRA